MLAPPATASPSPPPKRSVCIALAAIIAVGAVLRLRGLARDSLWYDEAVTALFALRPTFRGMLEASARNLHPPLVNALLWLSTQLLGDGEAALRLPSALAGVAALPAAFGLGRRMGGDRVGLYGALLLTLAPAHIHFSREARSYSLLALFAVVTTLAFVRLVEQRRPRDAALYALTLAAALYTHLLAGLLVLAQAVAALGEGVHERQGLRASVRRLLPVAIAMAGALVLFAPWLIYASGGLRVFKGVPGAFPLNLDWFASLLSQMGPGDGLASWWLRLGVVVLMLAPIAWALCSAPGAFARPSIRIVAWTLILPLAILSTSTNLRNLRSAFAWTPLFLLMLTFALAQVRLVALRRALAVGLIALALAAPFSSSGRYGPRTAWRSAAATIAARPDGPIVLAPAWDDTALLYYRARDSRLAQLPVRRTCRPQKDPTHALERLGRAPAFWLLEDDILGQCSLDNLVEALSGGYTVDADQRFNGLTNLRLRHLARR